MRDQMPPRAVYHSAHLPVVEASAVDRFELGSSVALVHDVATGVLPAEFSSCDVLYAEPPWPRGMAAFNERAGVSELTFRDLMAGVASIVEAAHCPTFVITGKLGGRRLPAPNARLPIWLNQWRAFVNVYHADGLPVPCGTTVELQVALADRFERVGDFCCGYGRALKLFAVRGKSFTGSDYNPHCIGYIAEHAAEWLL